MDWISDFQMLAAAMALVAVWLHLEAIVDQRRSDADNSRQEWWRE